METEYDFSGGERGKFYHPDAEYNFPIYLEPDVNQFMNKLAQERNVNVEALVNELLRSNIKVIQLNVASLSPVIHGVLTGGELRL